MNGYTESEFAKEKKRAIERMEELSRRSKVSSTSHEMPPAPSFVRLNTTKQNMRSQHFPPENEQRHTRNEKQPCEEKRQNGNNQSKQNFLSSLFNSSGNQSFSLPFLNGLKSDSDMTLILGLILLLQSENCDRMLLLALLYILF